MLRDGERILREVVGSEGVYSGTAERVARRSPSGKERG